MKNKIILGLSLLTIITLNSCKDDANAETQTFNCVDGNCIEAENGSFVNQAECEANCKAIMFTCNDGTCEQDENGEFVSMEECENNCKPKYGTVTDIDGNEYRTVRIGEINWMAENLKTRKFNNGDAIDYKPTPTEWAGAAIDDSPGYAIGTTPNISDYERDYGFLYNGYVVVDNRNVCPDGWEVPTIEDIETTAELYGGMEDAIGALLDTFERSSYITNESGLSLRFGGYREPNGPFVGPNSGYLWTSSKGTVGNRMVRYRDSGGGLVSLPVGYIPQAGFSIRCVEVE